MKRGKNGFVSYREMVFHLFWVMYFFPPPEILGNLKIFILRKKMHVGANLQKSVYMFTEITDALKQIHRPQVKIPSIKTEDNKKFLIHILGQNNITAKVGLLDSINIMIRCGKSILQT